MTIDIVLRLRDTRYPWHREMRETAADEITRLRSDLERTKDRIAAHKDENIALNIDVLRLRADLERATKALEEIAKIGDKITDPRNDYGIRMCNIAHAGLTVLAH